MSKVYTGTPDDVVLVESENLSRAASLAEREEQVTQRAIELFETGQTQPVRCYKPDPDSKPHIYIGFTRAAAVALIRRGFEVPTGEVESVEVKDEEGNVVGTEERPVTRTIHDPHFKLVYVIDDLTTEQAEVRGVADNFQNNKPNDLDLAKAAKSLQDKYGYSDAAVTRLLGVSDPYKVGRVKKLLSAPQFIQDAVQKGDLATATALEALNAPTADGKKTAKAFIKEALEKGKAPTQAAVRRAINTAAEEGSGGSDEQPAVKKAPPATEVRKNFEVLTAEVGGDDSLPDAYINVVGAMNRYLQGDIKWKTFIKKLDEALEVEKHIKRRKSKARSEDVVVEVESPVEA